MQAYIQLLRRNPSYARLWLASIVSLLGDWFNTIVLLALVSRYSQGSGLAVSGFLLARIIPPLLVGPYAGVLADRLNRKHLMIASDVLRAVVVLLFLIPSGPEGLWLVYLLTITQFSLTALFEPARSAVVPSLIGPDDLVQANTLDSVTWSFMLAAGGVVGGIVAAIFGTSGALIIDSATFVLSALLIWQIRVPHGAALADTAAAITTTPAAAQAASESPNTAARPDTGLMAGLRYAAQHPATALILFVKAGGRIGNSEALTTIFATQIFVMGVDGTESLGILYAASGIGAVLGPLLLNRFNNGTTPTMRRLITIGFVMIAAGLALMGGASSLWLVAAALVIRGMGGSANWTYSSIIIQKEVHNTYLGRMFALDMAAFQLVGAVTTLGSGWLIDLAGPTQAHSVAFILAAGSAITLVIWQGALIMLNRRQRATAYAPSGD